MATVGSVVHIGVYPNRADAELAQAALAVAGIPSLLEGDDVERADELTVRRTMHLLVADADLEHATAVLAARSDTARPEEK